MIQSLLRLHGPMSTSRLAELLVAEGLSPTAARQRIARRGEGIRSLDKLPLARNARFIYLTEDYASPRFWSSLIQCLDAVPGAYGRALAAIRARGGIVPLRHFAIASGSPVQMLRRIAADVVISRLVEVRLLQHIDVAGLGLCIALAKDLSYLETPVSEMQVRLIAENVLLGAISTWGKRLALGSYQRFELRDAGDNQPRVGAFEFDLAAPSYIVGLMTRVKDQPPKPGFFVCDVLLNGEVSLEAVQPFVHKCKTLALAKNMPRFMPIFVAERYSADALTVVRGTGIVPATTESLFGQEVARALKELMATLKTAADRAVDPEKFGRMFEALSAFEGAAGTLRGALFEFIANELARKVLHARTIMNKRVRKNGQDVAEIDVLAIVENRRVYFIECKGVSPESFVDPDEVKLWIERRIPQVRAWALQQEEYRQLEMVFELWTTAELSPESHARLLQAQQATRKYELAWRGPSELERMTIESGDKALLKVLRQHFIRKGLD